jgi:hypothetical protein
MLVLRQAFRFLGSLKLAIPLLVLLTSVTIVASLFPNPDLFRSWWYLSLLGAQGVSLLLVTIQHIPAILRRKGRNALIGVVTTHIGILVLIAGIIYGGLSGYRDTARLIEGQVTIIPELPFVLQLDRLVIEEYQQEEFPRMELSALPKKVQDSYVTILKNGKPVRSAVTAPGKPLHIDGFVILPAITDLGWYFELIVTDRQGREKTIPVRPWAPPLITVGNKRLMTHSLVTGDDPSAEFFAVAGDAMTPLGILSRDTSLEIDGNTVTLGPVHRFTGVKIYRRPQQPVLFAGTLLMVAGLLWHFYFRHRDSQQQRET